MTDAAARRGTAPDIVVNPSEVRAFVEHREVDVPAVSRAAELQFEPQWMDGGPADGQLAFGFARYTPLASRRRYGVWAAS